MAKEKGKVSTGKVKVISIDNVQETTGATPEPTTEVDKVVETSVAAQKPMGKPMEPIPARQTHGALPVGYNGPITSVSQLIRHGQPVANRPESFATLAEYSAYIKSLNGSELKRHAVEVAKMVPIDDRNRLIRRLETEWSAFAARSPNRKLRPASMSPQPYSQEQLKQLDALRHKILRD